MFFLKEILKKNHQGLWYSALFFSLLLLAIVFSQVEVNLLLNISNSITWPIFIIAIVTLLFEGVFTALRLKLYTPGNQNFNNCLEITAWFVVSLIVLPARLGEIAIILMLNKKLEQSPGSATMNILSQRLIDVLFLCAMLLTFLLANSPFESNINFLLIITSIISLLIYSILRLDILLGLIGIFLKRCKKKQILRKLLRMILQARIWHRFHLNNMLIIKSILLSSCKWACNIGGLFLLFYSLNIPIEKTSLILTSIAYNLLAIIPLQTIGGFGVSEAGLTGILVFFNLPIDLAASISVIVRAVLISTPFIFFIVVYFLNRYLKNENNC